MTRERRVGALPRLAVALPALVALGCTSPQRQAEVEQLESAELRRIVIDVAGVG